MLRGLTRVARGLYTPMAHGRWTPDVASCVPVRSPPAPASRPPHPSWRVSRACRRGWSPAAANAVWAHPSDRRCPRHCLNTVPCNAARLHAQFLRDLRVSHLTKNCANSVGGGLKLDVSAGVAVCPSSASSLPQLDGSPPRRSTDSVGVSQGLMSKRCVSRGSGSF